jgi:hypothetical protein
MEAVVRSILKGAGIPIIEGYPDMANHLFVEAIWSTSETRSGLSASYDYPYSVSFIYTLPIAIDSRKGQPTAVARILGYKGGSTQGDFTGYYLDREISRVTNLILEDFVKACVAAK